jgi:hypothetical protein
VSEKASRTRENLSHRVKEGVIVAQGGVNEPAALSKFQQSYCKSEVIFVERSTGSEMKFIHSGRALLPVWQDETREVPLVVLNHSDFSVR